jgi:membrane protein
MFSSLGGPRVSAFAGGPGGTVAMNSVERLARKADQFQQKHGWLAFPIAVWKKFGDDQAGNLAALTAYYAFVAIFPLLMVFVTVLGIVLSHDVSLQSSLRNPVTKDFPIVGHYLIGPGGAIRPLHETGPALAIGLIVAFLGARGVANAAQNAFNTVWAVPLARRPGFPWNQLRSVALILVVGIGELVTISLSGLAGGVSHLLPGFGFTVATFVISLLLNVGLFWAGFRLATANEIGWRELRLGAILSACAWQILQTVGGYLVGHQLAHSSALYGTFALALGLLAWLYLQAQVTLYAVEASVVRCRKLWPRSLAPPPLTSEDRRAYQMYAKAQRRRPDEEVEVTVDGAGRSVPAPDGSPGPPVSR